MYDMKYFHLFLFENAVFKNIILNSVRKKSLKSLDFKGAIL